MEYRNRFCGWESKEQIYGELQIMNLAAWFPKIVGSNEELFMLGWMKV
jgi:hypothetical protein